MSQRLLEADQISHTQGMVAREDSQIGQTFIYPYVKKLFKIQHGRIPTDPAILAAIRHRFIAPKKKIKMMMRAGLRQREQRLETFFGPNVYFYYINEINCEQLYLTITAAFTLMTSHCPGSDDRSWGHSKGHHCIPAEESNNE